VIALRYTSGSVLERGNTGRSDLPVRCGASGDEVRGVPIVVGVGVFGRVGELNGGLAAGGVDGVASDCGKVTVPCGWSEVLEDKGRVRMVRGWSTARFRRAFLLSLCSL